MDTEIYRKQLVAWEDISEEIFFVCLFLTVLGFHCCMWAFSSGKLGLPSSCHARASHRSGFSSCRVQALGAWASLVATCRLSSCGSRA